MALDPNIALGVRGIEVANPLAQYAQISQLQSAQNQNALAQYQLGAAQRAEAKDVARTNMLAQAGTNDTAIANALLKAGDIKGYQEFVKSRRETQKADVELVDAKLKQSRSFLDTINPADPQAPAQYLAWHQANHADPIIGPALAARGVTADQSMDRIQRAIQSGPQAFAQLINQSKLGTEKFMELNKPTTNVVNRGGQTDIVQIPGLGGTPAVAGTYKDVPLPADVQAQKLQTARAGASNVTVSTEKKYGERFGGLIAERDAAKFDAAEKAPELAESANRIIDIVRQGNVFTGPAADVKLNIARALNVAGASNEEKIANTEALVAATGKSTLDAIKGAGLGTGQGFTDKDLKFLQGVAGGTIALTQQALTDLARLQHQTAVRAADAWGKRVNELPKNVLQGTGLSTAPIKVPPLASASARPSGVGPNWTLERDAAGNTAWVSPDRKSFKEAK
jgi:hypothetical protein